MLTRQSERLHREVDIQLRSLARPTGFEPVTSAFGGQRSIQLSYGRISPLLAEFRSEGNIVWSGALRMKPLVGRMGIVLLRELQKNELKCLKSWPRMQICTPCGAMGIGRA